VSLPSLSGHLLAVNAEVQGDEVVVAGGTDGLLTVGDGADFDEDGGWVSIEGTLYQYSGFTDAVVTDYDEPVTLTLVAPFPGATIAAQTRVDAYSTDDAALVVEYVGLVLLDGQDTGDPVEATIDHALIPLLPQTVRPDGGNAVTLEWDGDDLVVVAVNGKVPLADGTYIGPYTVEPDRVTDGLPPSTSPTPTLIGFPKSVMARWDGVVNHDPVTYNVYVTDNDANTAGPTYLQKSTPDTATVISTIADGTPLQYGVTYFVAVGATDIDGAATISPWIPVQLNPNAAEDLAVGSVTAEKLESVLVLASKIATATSGSRVEIDNTGVNLFKSDGTPRASLPTQDTQAVYIDGIADLDEVRVRDNFSMGGVNNSLLPGSRLTLAGSVANPAASLQASISWPNVDTWYDPGEGTSADGYGLAWNSTDAVYAVANSFFGAQLMLFGEAGGFSGNVGLPEVSGYDNMFPYGGVTCIGTTYYLLGRCTRNSDGASVWQIRKYTVSAGVATLVASTNINTGANFNGGNAQKPAIGNDGTDLQVVYYNGGLLKRRNYTTALAFGSEVNLGSPPGGAAHDLGAVLIGNFDYGASRTLIAHRGGDFTFYAYNGTSRSANDDFPAASGTWVLGAVYNADAGNNTFRHFDGSGRLWMYCKNMWTTESSKWWPKFTWYDSDATGGTHETGLSKPMSLTMTKRAQIKLTCPTIPDAGGTDDPDSAKFYIGRGSTEPAYTAEWLNSSPAAGVRTVVLTGVVFSGSTHPNANVNNFPAAAVSDIADGAGSVLLDSSGHLTTPKKMQTGSVGTGTFSAANTVNSGNVTFPVAFDSTPNVTVSIAGVTVPANVYPPTSSVPTTTGFTWYAERATGTAAFTIEWIAMVP